MREKSEIKLSDMIEPKNVSRLKSMGYSFGHWIGGGNYGNIYNGTLWNTPIAFKLQNFSLVSAADRDIFVREIAMLKTLKHDNLIELYDVFVFDDTLVYTMEIAHGGDLCDLIMSVEFLNEPQTAKFYKQVGSGLKHLHLNGFAHCDLKPMNILLNGDRQICKICDYSLSQYIYSVYTGTISGSRGVIGTGRYLGPENFEFGMNQTTKLIDPQKIDVWAMGVTFFQCVNGINYPFECIKSTTSKENYERTMQKMSNVSTEVQWYNRNASKDFKLFINKHWVFDPKERPEVKELLYDKWLTVAGNTTKTLKNDFLNDKKESGSGSLSPLQLRGPNEKKECKSEMEPAKKENLNRDLNFKENKNQLVIKTKSDDSNNDANKRLPSKSESSSSECSKEIKSNPDRVKSDEKDKPNGKKSTIDSCLKEGQKVPSITSDNKNDNKGVEKK